jgi:hypothetical protein
MTSLTERGFASDGFDCPTHGRSEHIACRECLLDSLDTAAADTLRRNTPPDTREDATR